MGNKNGVFVKADEFTTGAMHKVVCSVLVNAETGNNAFDIRRYQTSQLTADWDGNKGGVTISMAHIDRLIEALIAIKAKNEALRSVPASVTA